MVGLVINTLRGDPSLRRVRRDKLIRIKFGEERVRGTSTQKDEPGQYEDCWEYGSAKGAWSIQVDHRE